MAGSLVLNVEILGEFKKLSDAVKGSEKSLSSLESGAKKFSKGINTALATVGIGLSVAALVSFGKEAIRGAEAAQVADKRLAQVTKSMNLFGSDTAKVTDRLVKFADKQELLTGVTAETVKQVQATLVTFGKLGQSANEVGGNFDKATKAALDLAAAGFGSAETNAIQLGKALQDPIKGLTALSRSGVTFTEQEKERIKTLVESNKLGEAQAMILAAIEQQVGGTAEATVTASARMEAAFGQIQDAVGLALLPVLEEFSLWLSTPEGQEKIQEVINGITDMITEFQNFVAFIMDKVMPGIEAFTGSKGLEAVAKAIAGLVIGLGTLKIALAIFTAGNPVLAGIIAGLALLAGAMFTVYQNTKNATTATEEFQRIQGLKATMTNPMTPEQVSGLTYRGLLGGLSQPSVPSAVPSKPGSVLQQNNITINGSKLSGPEMAKAINDTLKSQGSKLRIQ